MKEKTKEFVVYRIYYVDTGKSYIGITGDYEKRMKEHFCSKDDYYLHRAIQKHGKEKFIAEIIFECDSWDETKKEEIEYIKIFNTMSPNGYNLTSGGDGVLGYKHTKKTRKKISEGNKGKKCSEKACKKMSEAQQNRSEETCKKMSEANKNPPETTRKRMSDAQKGKKHSKKTRKKMSESGRMFSKDQILEIRKLLLQGLFQYEIAKKFNTHQTTIGCIKCNKVYADIQLPEKN